MMYTAYYNVAENLVFALDATLTSARGVFDETEKLMKSATNPTLISAFEAETYQVDFHESSRINKLARAISDFGAYPSYTRPDGFTLSRMSEVRDQKKRVEDRLSSAVLRGDDSQIPRMKFIKDFIKRVAEVHESCKKIRALQEKDDLSEPDRRLLDGLLECSVESVRRTMEAVESLTGYVSAI